jgi:hypothetical protein
MSATDYLMGRQGFLACSGGPPTLVSPGLPQLAGCMLPSPLQSHPARCLKLAALGFVQSPVQEQVQPQVLPTLGMPQSSAVLRLGGDGVGFGTVFHSGMSFGAAGASDLPSTAIVASGRQLPLPQTQPSTLSQIHALKFALQSPQTCAPLVPWRGAVTSSPCLPGSIHSSSVLPVGTAGGRASIMQTACVGGAVQSGANANTTMRAAHCELGAVLPLRDSAAHLAATLSSDETVSRCSESRSSEPCGSSDSSDSGDKKCRAWKIMLTAQQAAEIYKQLPADTVHITSKSVVVGKQFGVSAKTIRDIWKRETWVKATRPLWSEADEQKYQEHETRSAACSGGARAAPPGSVASLLSTEEARSPSPQSCSGASSSCGSRTLGRPKGVKDSRPRKRRANCLGGGGAGGHALGGLNAALKNLKRPRPDARTLDASEEGGASLLSLLGASEAAWSSLHTHTHNLHAYTRESSSSSSAHSGDSSGYRRKFTHHSAVTR